jgi:hypothetical protein
VISTDAHSAAQLFATKYYRGKGFVQPFEFFGVSGIGIFEDGEFLFVRVVAWIDTYFLDVEGGLHRSGGEEVNVSDQWHVTFGGAELFRDFAERLGGGFVGCGDTDDLAARFSEGKTVASMSCVLVVVIDWMRTGLSPPMATLPTWMMRDSRRVA